MSVTNKVMMKSCLERNNLSVSTLFFILLLLWITLSLSISIEVECKEVFAIGDLHGDMKNGLDILQYLGIIKKIQNNSMSDHQQHGEDDSIIRMVSDGRMDLELNLQPYQMLIQTGDLLDRGEYGIDLLRLSMKWSQAYEEQFVQLIGNHEAMNIMGYFHYVNLDEWKRHKDYESLFSRPDIHAECRYIINQMKTVHLVDETLFVHAGLLQSEVFRVMNQSDVSHSSPNPPDVIKLINDQMSHQLKHTIEDKLNHRTLQHSSVPLLTSTDSPIWTRKLSDAKYNDQYCNELYKTLELLGAKRMVVGHTVQQSGNVTFICRNEDTGGGLILIDTGISDYYGGKLSAIRIVDGKDLFIHYRDRVEHIPLSSEQVISSQSFDILERLDQKKENFREHNDNITSFPTIGILSVLALHFILFASVLYYFCRNC